MAEQWKDPITTGMAMTTLGILAIFVVGELLPGISQQIMHTIFLFALGAFSVWNNKRNPLIHTQITGPGTLGCGVLALLNTVGIITLYWEVIWALFVGVWAFAWIVENVDEKKKSKKSQKKKSKKE